MTDERYHDLFPVVNGAHVELPKGLRLWTPDDELVLRPPQLDVDALDGPIGEYVTHMLPRTEAHPAAILGKGLPTIGARLGRDVRVTTTGEIEQIAAVFTLTIGQTSSGRKGTGESDADRLLDEAWPGWRAANEIAGFGSGEKIVEHFRDRDASNPDDEGGHSCAVIAEQEGDLVFAPAGRDGSTISARLRQMFDGKPMQHRTKSGGDVRASNYHAGVYVAITPSDLARVDPTAQSNGFLNRFLMFHVAAANVLPWPERRDQALVARVADMLCHNVVQRVDRSASYLYEIERHTPAGDVWERYYMENATGVRGHGTRVRELTARAPQHVMRLAMIFAATKGSPTIDVASLTAAIALVDYSTQTVRYTWPTQLGDDESKLLDAVRDSGRDGLTHTEQSAVFNRNRNRQQLDALRRALQRHRLIHDTIVDGAHVSIATAETAR